MTDEPEYEIGYRRPPVHSQFQKGVSGNPRGRQKGVRNFNVDVKRSLKIPVTLSENGKNRKVSTQEALLLRLREKALKGDARALDRLLALAQIHNVEPPADLKDAAFASADDQAILDAYLEDAGSRKTRPRSVTAKDDVPAPRDEEELS